MATGGHTCYHCKQWVDEGEAHDCWTTTETALTAELTDELRDAWERLRETAAELGEQRIYASHHSIMFSRKSCYFFVRPKRSFLEVNIFLGRRVTAPQVQKVVESSAAKKVHVIRLVHRDQVEAPLTDWLLEAYEYNVRPRSTGNTKDTKDTKSRHEGAKTTTKAGKARVAGEARGATSPKRTARVRKHVGPSRQRRIRAAKR